MPPSMPKSAASAAGEQGAPHPVHDYDLGRERLAAARRAAVGAALWGALSLFIGLTGPLAIRSGLRARRAGASEGFVLFSLAAGAVSTGFMLLGIILYLLAALR